MIIKKLVLHNFRVFRGTHEIDLAPKRNVINEKKGIFVERPIILFGGLNGAGKTSVLTAIRLALYGRLAFENMIQNQDYIDQLTALVHNGTSETNRPVEASIELTFTYNKDGQESEFTIVRSWKRGHKDRLKLIQNNESLDELNYDQCQGFLNELIPHGIADLFFFDGEKIAALAEDSSGKVLQTAVRRLLGLDVVSKLKDDLSIYLKRQDAKELGASHQEKLTQLEYQKSEFLKSAEKIRYEADLVKARIELLNADISKYESQLAAEGGAFALTKGQEQDRVNALVKEKDMLEKQIRHEFEGTLPFSLAKNTLGNLLSQLKQEAEIKQTKHFTKELNLFLEKLKQDMAFRSKETYAIAKEAIEDQLTEYLNEKPKGEVILDISERETGMIQQAIEVDSLRSWERFDQAKIRLAEVEHSLEQASTNIQRAPDDEQLMTIFSRIRELDTKRQSEVQTYKLLLNDAKSATVEALNIARQIQKQHDKARSLYGETNAVLYASESINLLEEYSKVLTLARVRKLETIFAAAYQKLARKEDLQISARINPDNFDVELIDEHGTAINRKSLSAGEKQIYAIAILEALAKTSGRQLPVIIDTPLGRLDSHHRDKLIEHYFPFASHQVVLLSTDTEVDEKYFATRLQDDISHAYQISFDSKTKSSRLVDGYFWKN